MKQTCTLLQKIDVLIRILWPIFITQAGLFAMNFFDTAMSGNVSADDLAGVAIGSSIWVPIFTGINGILMGMTPIISQLLGKQKKNEISFATIQGLYLSIAIAIITLLIGSAVLQPLLVKMELTKPVTYIAHHYLIGLSFGIFPLFGYAVIRSFIDALGQTRVTMLITLISLPINVFFNYGLIFGKLGFPKLGGVGAGYATAITYWVIFLFAVLVIIKQRPFRSYQLFQTFIPIHFSTWKELLKIGIPIGFAMFFETSIFSAVTLLMSEYDTITIASHQAAMNFASYLYMIPLSISMALTIVIGFEVGAKRYQDARIYSFLGISIGVFLAMILSIFLYFYKTSIAQLYTNDEQVLQLTEQFLLYAILFQLSDAFGAPIQGALRGYKDVNATFMMALISYWVIGLPVGFALAQFTSFAAFGYWIGLIVGLATGAITLLGRLLYIQNRKYQLQDNKNGRKKKTLFTSSG